MQIGIFPAAGGLGGSTYNHLLKQVDPKDVTLISRHPEKVPLEYITSGVTNRQMSWQTSVEAYGNVFDGIDVLFLVSYPTYEHEVRNQHHRPAIDAAIKSGVKHIFYSSLGFARNNDIVSSAFVMQAHLDTEEYLSLKAKYNKDFSWTSIREGIYSESFAMYTGFFDMKLPSGEILLPHNGSGPGVSWVKRDELGEGSAKLISNYVSSPKDFPHINTVVLLTGAKSYSLSETVEILGRIAGKTPAIRKVSIEEYSSQEHVKKALKTDSVRKVILWATSFEALRKGETAVVSPLLEELLGRKPEDFEITIRAGVDYNSKI